jgi:hypothetical protein
MTQFNSTPAPTGARFLPPAQTPPLPLAKKDQQAIDQALAFLRQGPAVQSHNIGLDQGFGFNLASLGR